MRDRLRKTIQIIQPWKEKRHGRRLSKILLIENKTRGIFYFFRKRLPFILGIYKSGFRL